MELPCMSILWTLAVTIITLFLGNIIITYAKQRKAFTLPSVGAGSSDINALKERYVKEADVLLREGYEGVSYHVGLQAFLGI